MKKLLLTLAALVVIAAPSYAYVQSGNLPKNTAQRGIPIAADGGLQDVGIGALAPPDGSPVEPFGDQPPVTHPVPEPATMVLASMGLIALGAAGRKRRSRG